MLCIENVPLDVQSVFGEFCVTDRIIKLRSHGNGLFHVLFIHSSRVHILKTSSLAINANHVSAAIGVAQVTAVTSRDRRWLGGAAVGPENLTTTALPPADFKRTVMSGTGGILIVEGGIFCEGRSKDIALEPCGG